MRKDWTCTPGALSNLKSITSPFWPQLRQLNEIMLLRVCFFSSTTESPRLLVQCRCLGPILGLEPKIM